MFFENYKKFAHDFIFQSKDAKLREVLNVKPVNVRQKTRLRHGSTYFITDKEVNV